MTDYLKSISYLAPCFFIVIACSGGTDIPPATGTLEVAEIDIAPTVTGRVQRVLVEEGATVQAGQTLAELAQPTTAADIAGRVANMRAAEAEVRRTGNDVRRLGALRDAGAISQQQFEVAQTAARVAAGRLDAARASVAVTSSVASDLILHSPINGVVLSRNIEPGEVVNPSQSAITIGDLSRPWVRVYVNQKNLPSIKLNSRVTAVLDGIPDKKFTGKVVSINRQAEYTPRVALTEKERADIMFGVKIEFNDASGALKPGLPITVDFQGGK